VCVAANRVPFSNPVPATMMARRPRTTPDNIREKKAGFPPLPLGISDVQKARGLPPLPREYACIRHKWNKDEAFDASWGLGDDITSLPPSPVFHISRRARPSQLPRYSLCKSKTLYPWNAA
jgi:hypothetical protein